MTKIRRSVGPFALAALLAAVASCGGGGSSTPITEDDFCQQKAEKECQITVKCGTVTTDMCIAQRKPVCLAIVAMSKTVVAPNTKPRIFHRENVSACVSETNRVYAQATITPADLEHLADTCSYVFQGDSTGLCAVKYDCADKNQICDKSLCAAKTNANKGQGCANAGQVCAPDSYCAADPASPTNALTCLAKAAEAETCGATVPCVNTLRCDGTTLTCLPKLMAGEVCTANSDCPTAAPYCDPAIGKCDSGLIFAPDAAACRAYGGGASGSGGSGGGTGGASGGNDAGSDVSPAG